MARTLTYLARYIIAMIKKLNSKGTMNGALTILTGVLVPDRLRNGNSSNGTAKPVCLR